MKQTCLHLIIVLFMSAMSLNAQAPANPKSALHAEPIGELDARLSGSSTLFFLGQTLWSCNDHDSLVIYALDTLTAQIQQTQYLGRSVSDMEEVTQDEAYLYWGDFGNNRGDGLRTDLHILRLAKDSLDGGQLTFDTIRFTYPNYPPQGKGNDNDFDCEAMVVAGDSIYLFTKEWISLNTTCYALPKVPGSHTAVRRYQFDVAGLITGAAYHPDRQILTFCGYNSLCFPFVYLCYGFGGMDLLSGMRERISLDNGIGTQIEGIATLDGVHYFLSSEQFDRMGGTRKPQLFQLDLTEPLYDYLHPDTVPPPDTTSQVGIVAPNSEVSLYPNPTADRITFRHARWAGTSLTLVDLQGRVLLHLTPISERTRVDLSPYPAGRYTLLLREADGTVQPFSILKGGNSREVMFVMLASKCDVITDMVGGRLPHRVCSFKKND